jgi:hypothetical protein
MKIEYILSFLPTFLTICLSFLTACIGVFVAFVGYQQYRISRERFKLDLFEKRFSVYKGIQVFLTHILINANFELEQFYKFRADTQDATFLFDKDITDYIDLIDKKSLEFNCLCDELKSIPVGEERTKKCEEKGRLLKWLIGQLPKLKEVFAPYLKFKTWK